MSRISIHQPMYLPYPGIFNKMMNVDIFVFLDDAQYTNTYYYNRNKIKTSHGELLLTVPVISSHGQKLNDVKIDNNTHWQKKHLKSLFANYSKANYFVDYIDFFEKISNKKWEKLHDLNIETMCYLINVLDIDIPFYLSSDLEIDAITGTQRLIDICEAFDAEIYLSGPSGKSYLNENLFQENRIKIEYQNYFSQEYHQLWGSFIPNLSIIDMLFNVGDKAKKLVK